MFQLAKRPGFRSCDLDETRGHISHVFKQHHLEIEGRSSRLDASICQADFGPISLVYLRHGADVFIDPDTLLDFYLLQIPIDGTAEYEIGREFIQVKSGEACLISPTQRLRIRFKADCRHFILKLDRAYLERVLAEELNHVPSRPLIFNPLINLADRGAAGVLGILNHLDDRAFADDATYTLQNVQSASAQLLVRTMVNSLSSNFSESIQNMASYTVLPRQIKRAEAYIAAHLMKKLTPSEIAAAASTSLSGLHRGFKEHFNLTPMEYVKSKKMTEIRRILQSDNRPTSVGEIAHRFGFDHLGHFSASYCRRYGELPSITLRSN